MEKINILLADTQPLTNLGIKSLIDAEDQIAVVGEVMVMQELMKMVSHHQPTVLIVDYAGIEGFDPATVTLLKDLAENMEVLIITADDDEAVILNFLQRGVRGFVTKVCSSKEILEAILAVALGKKFFCSKVLDILLEQRANPQYRARDKGLTDREREVLKLIAEGNMTKEIASKLNLSPHTINSHRKNIIKKLAIKSPTEFVIKAMDIGLM